MAARSSSGLRLYVGGDIDIDLIKAAEQKFSQADVHPLHGTTRHLFETLQDDDNFAKKVFDAWAAEPTNLARIAPGKTVKRLRHAPIRVNSLSRPVLLRNGIREEEGICVFIPLQSWHVKNGCFLRDTVVQPGECVCIDGLEPVTFFPCEGGALLIWAHVLLQD